MKLLAAFALLSLVGCGPDACQKQGGKWVVDHYESVTQFLYIPDGNGNIQLIPYVQQTPVLRCEKAKAPRQ